MSNLSKIKGNNNNNKCNLFGDVRQVVNYHTLFQCKCTESYLVNNIFKLTNTNYVDDNLYNDHNYYKNKQLHAKMKVIQTITESTEPT